METSADLIGDSSGPQKPWEVRNEEWGLSEVRGV